MGDHYGPGLNPIAQGFDDIIGDLASWIYDYKPKNDKQKSILKKARQIRKKAITGLEQAIKQKI